MTNDLLTAVLEDIRSGRPIVLVDDPERENEGDLMIAAEKISSEWISFMLLHCRGLVCLSLTAERLRELAIPLQVTENRSVFGTNFGVGFDHRSVAEDGESAKGRSTTIQYAINSSAKSSDFVMPGYVFPLCAVPGGVLKRRGQTEGAVDLARLAGLSPAGVICEIMDQSGEMLRGAALKEFCNKNNFKMVSIAEIANYRLHHETSIRRIKEYGLSSEQGMDRNLVLTELLIKHTSNSFKVVVYADDVEQNEHLAFIKGEVKNGCLVRIHSECLTGDVFQSERCDCGQQLDRALAAILQEGQGVVVYLHQEGRGIGLGNKIKAYQLQQQGLDTVDANIHLGFAPDERDYRAGAQILKDLGLTKIRLMTNNPEKMQSLADYGVEVIERVPIAIEPSGYNADYLQTKRVRMGHLGGSNEQ